MGTQVNERRRRRLLVDPPLQYELIAWALLALTAATAVFSGILLFVLQDVRVMGESIALPSDHPYFVHLDELRSSTVVAVAVTFVGLGAALIYGGLVRSRRIAGPILALRRHLDTAAEGSPAPIAFRADDHFADLSARFNRLVDLIDAKRD
jgi:hypothetical protein